MDRHREEWISTGEAAHLLRMSPQWVREGLIRSGRLEAIPTLAGYIMRRSDVEAIAQKRAELPPNARRRPLMRELVEA